MYDSTHRPQRLQLPYTVKYSTDTIFIAIEISVGSHRGRTIVVHVTFAYHLKVVDRRWFKLYVQLLYIFKFHLQPTDFYPTPKCSMYTVWSVVIQTQTDYLYPSVIRVVRETNSGFADTSQRVYYTCSWACASLVYSTFPRKKRSSTWPIIIYNKYYTHNGKFLINAFRTTLVSSVATKNKYVIMRPYRRCSFRNTE